MSTRFFASVRRNQKQWMVVVTVLSMISFLFLDNLTGRKGPMSAFGAAATVGVLCGAAMCIIGYPRQKTMEFGLGGFLVGFLAGYVGFGAQSLNNSVARTSVGSFSRDQLAELAQERQKLNQFFTLVAMKAQTGQAPSFGGIDDESLIYSQIQLAEAKKMGIQISKERVDDFYKQISGGKLTDKEVNECLRESRLSMGEMIKLAKLELASNLARELTRPPSFVPEIPREFAPYMQQMNESLQYMQPTPLQLWDDFQKLNLHESLETVAVPVRSFVGKVGEPSDSELGSFFDKYKGNRWVDEAHPGFAQMPRVQLAYLTGDYEKFETGADPTEAEILEYYAKNKERYRITAPKLPEDAANATGSNDATKSEAPPLKDEPESTEQKPPADGTPKGDTPDASKEKESPPKEDKSDDSKSNCGGRADDQAATDSSVKPAEDKPDAEKSTDEPTNKAATGDAAADAHQPANSKTDSSIELPDAPAPPKYRDLDDELRLDIRDAILRERSLVLGAAEVDKAYELMVNLSLEYDTVTDAAKKKEKAEEAASQLKKFANEHKLIYRETTELTYEDLTAETIGGATEGNSRTPVVNEIFTMGARGEPRMPLYSPHRADSKLQGSAFAYWKIAYTPVKIMDLKDSAAHAKVVSAWKFDQARSLAEKRANELATKAKSGDKILATALAGESVTGDKLDPSVVIIPTDDFTWLSSNRSIPGSRSGPTISLVLPLNQVNNDFMKEVFQTLDAGGIGVAPDDSHTVYYVIKVKQRDDTGSDDGGVAKRERQSKFMKEEFSSMLYPLIKTPYQWLSQVPQHQIEQAWARNFQDEHQVSFEETAIPSRPRR